MQSILRRHRYQLGPLGAANLIVFGSVARGEQCTSSDLCLLVDLNRRMGLFEFAGLKLRLEELLGVPADQVMPVALKSGIRDRVLREAVRAA